MAGSQNLGNQDQEATDAIASELAVLGRLLYRNRSQHRGAKYFSLVLEVRQECRRLATPKLPDLLAQGLGLLARVPDSRNHRAREAWVRSAAVVLRRMRAAVVACTAVLEAIVQACRHLAHQVSQTYFMALSVVFLACLARLFACILHLGGRLLEIHGALLRVVLAQPCTSECLSPSALAECRIPVETTTFLSCLRGAGGAHKASWMKAIKTGSTVSEAVATPVKAVSVHGAVPDVGLAPHVDIDADVDGLGEVKDRQSGSDHFATGGDDDVGALVGRATPVTLKPIEKTVVMEESTQAGDEGGGQGGSKAVKGVAKSGKATQRAGRESGGNAGAQQQQQQKKQVVLASEFSDSSSDDSDGNDDNGKPQPSSTREKALNAFSPVGERTSQGATGTFPLPSKPALSAMAPSLSFFSNKTRSRPFHQRQPTETTIASTVGSSRVGEVDDASDAHVGWVVDRGPTSAPSVTLPERRKGCEGSSELDKDDATVGAVTAADYENLPHDDEETPDERQRALQRDHGKDGGEQEVILTATDGGLGVRTRVAVDDARVAVTAAIAEGHEANVTIADNRRAASLVEAGDAPTPAVSIASTPSATVAAPAPASSKPERPMAPPDRLGVREERLSPSELCATKDADRGAACEQRPEDGTTRKNHATEEHLESGQGLAPTMRLLSAATVNAECGPYVEVVTGATEKIRISETRTIPTGNGIRDDEIGKASSHGWKKKAVAKGGLAAIDNESNQNDVVVDLEADVRKGGNPPNGAVEPQNAVQWNSTDTPNTVKVDTPLREKSPTRERQNEVRGLGGDGVVSALPITTATKKTTDSCARRDEAIGVPGNISKVKDDHTPRTTATSGGVSGRNRKRSSIGDGRAEGHAQKQSKKRQKKGGSKGTRGKGKGGDGRKNAIDDIFGALF